MATVTGFRTPEEAALDLELPLLGAVGTFPVVEGPVAAAWPADDASRRQIARAGERLLQSPLAREGPLGVIGDVPSSRRARVAAAIAASLAAVRTTVLVDADLRAGQLSFDDRRRAQEGLVDVLRYGVRSPRVVSPTLTPGLSLLPVGSRTLDLEGTYGAEAVPGLLAELARGGELLVVNGPGAPDVDAAEPFLARVAAWVLVHEIGVSDAERTRALRDRFGRERCAGIVVLAGERPGPVAAPPPEPAPEPVAVEAAAPPAAPPEPAAAAEPEAEPEPEVAAEPAVGTIASAWQELDAPVRRGRPRGLLLGLGAVVVASVAAFLLFGRDRGGTLEEALPAPTPPVAVAPPAEETPAETIARALPVTPPEETPEPVAVAPPAEEKPAPPPVAAAPPVVTRPAAAPAGGDVFAVHLASVKSRDGAGREAAALAGADRPTFLRETEVADKGTWWRVYAGPWETRAEAERVAASLRSEGRDYAQVHRLRREEVEAGTGREER